MTKVCVVTGTRAEYGLLKPVIEKIQKSQLLKLQLVVTGSHLSSEHGMTVEEIKSDNFNVDKTVECLINTDTAPAITKSMGIALIGFADALKELRPDILVILGDRFEIFMAATAAMTFGVPIAHIQGGEITEGAIDDAIRHSITKMSHLHFVATNDYGRRVAQLGEDPNRVYVVGGLGVENSHTLALLSRQELEANLKIKFSKKNLLITLHPETIESGGSKKQVLQLLKSLDELEETSLIFTLPNADTDNNVITKYVRDFADKLDDAHVYTSLGTLRYLSCVKVVDAVVGNSSSGLLEAPSLKTATINIGNRQKGRTQAASVINVPFDTKEISTAIETVYSSEFKKILRTTKNPYYKPNTSKNITSTLENMNLTGILKKSFVDLH